MNPLFANAAARLGTTVATKGFQRHYAFGVTDPVRAPMDHAVALISSLACLLVNSAVLTRSRYPAGQLVPLGRTAWQTLPLTVADDSSAVRIAPATGIG